MNVGVKEKRRIKHFLLRYSNPHLFQFNIFDIKKMFFKFSESRIEEKLVPVVRRWEGQQQEGKNVKVIQIKLLAAVENIIGINCLPYTSAEV